MDWTFPIIDTPAAVQLLPILVSIPHYGTQALPSTTNDDYSEPWFQTFAYGFADTFVGDIYRHLHQHGATIVATPLSRIFVDVNRPRHDFTEDNGIIKSQRGVVRTHTIRDKAIFTQALSNQALEERLTTFYDPYYATLSQILAQLHQTHGYALLLDSHTGSPRRMLDYQVILGTQHGKTCHYSLEATIAEIFTIHGFDVHHNISGYAGGNIVRTYGQPDTTRTHAIQLEINSSLLMMAPREEFIAQVSRGEVPPKNETNINRLQSCLTEIITALPPVLEALYT